jgi:prepilin-type N-terminal cleavage/methylation domain-containing protein
MSKNKRMSNRKGFTLIELMIATGLASAIVVGVGMLLVDSQRGWNTMYSRTYSDVSTDAHVARRMFDRVVRNASSQGILLDEFGAWVEVYYYSDPNSVVVDRYARFYGSNNQLLIEYGALNPKQTLNTEIICGNVSSYVFKSAGNSVQMLLTLDNGSQSATIVASAVTHNQ